MIAKAHKLWNNWPSREHPCELDGKIKKSYLLWLSG